MDFHTLARRELQALCKKNKIPANMTNVAMADALQALQTVEGLEELLANPETEYLKTPARSSVARTSTRRTVARKKDVLDVAPPSACAQEGNKSTMSQAYNTRRSTRLLEKQMSALSLKENRGDVVDTKVDLEKESCDLQRKFSEDLDNTQDSELDESVVVENQEQNVEVVLEKEQPLVDGIAEPLEKNDLENAINEDGETKSISDALIADEVEEAIHENEVKQMEETPQIEISSDECEKQPSLNGTDEMELAAKEDTSSFTAETNQIAGTEEQMQDHVAVNGQGILSFEADPIADAPERAQYSASPVVISQILDVSVDNEVEIEDSQSNLNPTTLEAAVDHVATVEGAEQKKVFEMKVPELTEDEFYFLTETENDSDNDEEVDGVQDNTGILPESLLAVVEATSDLGSLNQNNDMANVESQSSSKISASVHRNVPISDNKENIEVAMRKMSIMQDAPAGTPIEKKSLRQLKKILMESYKQKAEKKRPALQAHPENIVAAKTTGDN